MRFVKLLALTGLILFFFDAGANPQWLLGQTLVSKVGDFSSLPQPAPQPAPKLTSLKEALGTLENAYGVRFLYEEAVVHGKTVVPLAKLSKSFDEDLRQVMGDNHLTYARVGNSTIVIMPKEQEPPAEPMAPAGGTIKGQVRDATGQPLAFALMTLDNTSLGDAADHNGEFEIANVPPGTYTLRVRMLGYRPESASVTVSEGATATQNFDLVDDALMMSGVVVTGTLTPRPKLESTVAISTLAPRSIEQAAPRSTTEMLRYIPGFTRVESSGGEVNQNISIRGILGVEYVMFMEDGMPVFPTMHTFFMNADNLFRPDENIATVEVVRGGSSALFGSNTPRAIINFVNKTGGPEMGGTLKASAATEGLARYDFNLNGPLGENWRFNLGGFYRYDHGVRDPVYPGIRGGQFKGNVTRMLDNGYIRASFKFSPM